MDPKWRVVAACLGLAITACAGENGSESLTASSRASVTTASANAQATDQPTPIRLRIDRRVADAATEGFKEVVQATLNDRRGWRGAGFGFSFGEDAPFTVVLAESDVVDELCRPYDVGGRFSCQIGPVVALNADRWRQATPQWTGDLGAYRQMLINHEVGHLLGQHHPEVQCLRPGEPAPIMAQQSAELGGCIPNAWPRPWEIECASRHVEPVAPGYESDPTPTCGSQD